MNDLTPFEQQIRVVLDRMGGAEPKYDAMAVARVAVSGAPRGRLSAVTVRLGFRSSGGTPARGLSMVSAASIVAAAAIVALLGGLLLAGVMGEPQDGEPPPAAVSPTPLEDVVAVQAPTDFRASFECSTYWEDGQQMNVVVGPVEGGNLVRRETRGELGRFEAESDDERLQGEWTVYTSTDEYFWPGVDPNLPLVMGPGALHIVTDEGSWQGPWGHFALPGSTSEESVGGVGYLTGSGAYDGLTVLFQLGSDNWDDCYCFASKGFTAASERCRFQMEGLIVEGVPPTPHVPE